MFPKPGPFVYHPEVYPELAEHNVAPYNFEIPRSKKLRNRNPQTLSCSRVPNPSRDTGFVDLSGLLDQESFSNNRGYAYNMIDNEAHDQFQSDLKARVEKTLGVGIKRPEVIYTNT